MDNLDWWNFEDFLEAENGCEWGESDCENENKASNPTEDEIHMIKENIQFLIEYYSKKIEYFEKKYAGIQSHAFECSHEKGRYDAYKDIVKKLNLIFEHGTDCRITL